MSRPGLDSYADLGEVTSPGRAAQTKRSLRWKVAAGLVIVGAVVLWTALSHNGFVARPVFGPPVSVATSLAR